MFTAVSAKRGRTGDVSRARAGTPWGGSSRCPAGPSPCLSPVSTQILMLASVSRAMVSGTPC